MDTSKNRKRDYCIFSNYDDKQKVIHAFLNGATTATVAFRADGGNLLRVKMNERQPFVDQFIGIKKVEGVIWRNGELYVTCWDLEAALKMLCTQSWLGIPLIARLVEYRIVTKHVVKNVHAVISLESIAEELDRQGIIWQQIIRLKKPGSTESLPVILIKELGKVQREYIKMWSVTFIVDEYEEKPIVCKKCLKFGHIINKCGGKYVCPNCGLNHKAENCAAEEKKCVRCDSTKHDTFSKKCPMYVKEKEIINIKIKEQIDYNDALFMYEKNEGKKDNSMTELDRQRILDRERDRFIERLNILRGLLNPRVTFPDIIYCRNKG